jgi:hypothetical protein
MLTFETSIKHFSGILARAVRQEKRRKVIQAGKKKYL